MDENTVVTATMVAADQKDGVTTVEAPVGVETAKTEPVKTEKTDTAEVEKAADEILAANPKAVAEYKEGSGKVFGFLMGQMCRALGKSANPAIIKKVLEEKLK